LVEPYASTLTTTINNLNSSNEKLNNIEENQASSSEISNIENNIQNTKSSVTILKQEINKLKEVDADRLTDPIILSYYSASDDQSEGSVNKRLESLDYLFPSFLIFFLLFDSLIFSTLVTIKERTSNSYIRNVTSKNNGLTFIIGNILTALFLITIQTVIILLVASFFLNLDILSNVYSLIPIILISILIFSLIGAILGYLFNSYETAIISAISISLLFFIFSSIISPVETLPGILSEVIKLSPLTLLETKLRIILVFDSFFGFDLVEALALGLVFLVSSVLIGVFYKKNKEKEI
jgi:ABC-type multidrug transport system permease subunit